ncbi:MAG: 2-amino-4-hydroxy-6-hydroxymethyldihydropteridine diphosphokinase [Bacteroidales bacterium]|jgi:2-amino-4-hydroxy-6-hydroxymethyldihydropteridine diphosphokinase|nr:2-amino-4-hydroxy-6-hydroxymethyldihydropteridine diphosphokinase [Bacteroidales bacterium]
MKIVLSLGSNLGKRAENLQKAYVLLEQCLGKIIAKSSIIETKPWGFEAKTQFLNSVIVIDTDKNPSEALSICLQIEQTLGRIRSNAKTYQSRTIDIDILFYNNLTIETSELLIPHPLICQRSFVLIPLKEILPDFIHPTLNTKIKDIPLPE